MFHKCYVNKLKNDEKKPSLLSIKLKCINPCQESCHKILNLHRNDADMYVCGGKCLKITFICFLLGIPPINIIS
jgi:hypothetical protein